MGEKLEYVKPAELKEAVMKFGWLEEYGSFNRIPQPFMKLTDATFADIAKRGTPEYMEYRMLAIIEKDADKYIPSMIYWYKDTGIMIVFDETTFMRFYQLGCQHDYDEIDTGKDRVDIKCKKCGYTDTIYTMDPSDSKESVKE
jgi:hypothetical protein